MTLSQVKNQPAQNAPPEAASLSLPRRFFRAGFFWLFGLSASILLGSLWGSAVTGSRGTAAQVIRDVATEQVVQDRIAGWIAEGLDSVGVITPGDTATVDRLMAMPETEQVLDNLTDQIVEAMFAPVGTTALVDPASALLPVVPQIIPVLAEAGVPADASSVAALVSQIEPIPLDGSGEIAVTSAATRVSAALSLAALVAGLAALLFGAGAVLIESRPAGGDSQPGLPVDADVVVAGSDAAARIVDRGSGRRGEPMENGAIDHSRQLHLCSAAGGRRRRRSNGCDQKTARISGRGDLGFENPRRPGVGTMVHSGNTTGLDGESRRTGCVRSRRS